jgi:hypothetical protein
VYWQEGGTNEKKLVSKAVYEGPVVQFYGVDGNFSIPKY